MKHKHLWISIFIFIFLCLAVDFFGGSWTRETVTTWYPQLVKPAWAPPNWLFGPVWMILYLMIAVSGWLLYSAEHSRARSVALTLYSLQLFLNFIWSFLFFALRSPVLGLIDIVLLLLAIILTIIKSWNVRPLASLLLYPYLLWVIYAASLNAAIWILNR